MIYQERLLLYADVLGWSAEVFSGAETRLFRVIEAIHANVEHYNKRSQQELLSREGKVI